MERTAVWTFTSMMGLLRKLDGEKDFPFQLLEDVNSFVSDTLGFKFVKFVLKPFDLQLKTQIEAQEQMHPEFNYFQWKYYLEQHRDLCYVSNEKSYYFADNVQTIVHTNIQTLRQAMANIFIWEDKVPCHLNERGIGIGGGIGTGTGIGVGLTHKKNSIKGVTEVVSYEDKNYYDPTTDETTRATAQNDLPTSLSNISDENASLRSGKASTHSL